MTYLIFAWNARAAKAGICPANVDMAKIKYQFLAHYSQKHGMPLRSRLFARIETLESLGQPIGAGVQLGHAEYPNRAGLFQRAFGVAPARSLHPFFRPTLVAWYARHQRG